MAIVQTKEVVQSAVSFEPLEKIAAHFYPSREVRLKSSNQFFDLSHW